MDIKLGLGIPSSGHWHSYTGLCVASMVGYWERSLYEGGKKELEILSVTAHLPQGRHIVVEEAVKAGCTHLLWIDSDMVFPPDAPQRLLRHGKMVVGCNYPRRVLPCITTGYQKGEFENDQDGVLYSGDDKTGLEEVKHLGFGLVLTDMEVFNQVEPPWFVFEPSGKWGLSTRGEDVYFCEKYTEHTGLPIWCDHDLSKEVAHCGDFIYTHRFAEAWRDNDPAINRLTYMNRSKTQSITQPEGSAFDDLINDGPDDRSAA